MKLILNSILTIQPDTGYPARPDIQPDTGYPAKLVFGATLQIIMLYGYLYLN